MRTLEIAFLAFGATSLVAADALAADCTQVTTNAVYAAGSTAIGPVVEAIAAYLAGLGTPITLVYGGTGSCTGVQDVINNAVTPNSTPLVTPAGKSNFFIYYDASGTQQTCDLTAADNVYPNIGLSDVFAQSCPLTSPLTQPLSALGIDERLGPVQAMTFVVPQSSGQYSISAQAAYLTFGFGGLTPGIQTQWTDVMSMFQRGPTSGTQAMIATAIGVPSSAWFGVIESSTGAMKIALGNAQTAMNALAIGILGTADVDPVRQAGNAPYRYLAYQHYGQNCAYLPDSLPATFDKQNVRDGHYAIWGQLHVLTTSSNSNISTIVNDITGFSALGSTDVISEEAKAGLVPYCAMHVQRMTEVGDLSPLSQGSTACSCYFEHVALGITGGDTSCAKCTDTAQCSNGSSCQTAYGPQGYCEPP